MAVRVVSRVEVSLRLPKLSNRLVIIWAIPQWCGFSGPAGRDTMAENAEPLNRVPGEELTTMGLTVELEQETDGRWLAEAPELPGVLAYGQTRPEAIARAQALALHEIADRLDHGESVPPLGHVFAAPA